MSTCFKSTGKSIRMVLWLTAAALCGSALAIPVAAEEARATVAGRSFETVLPPAPGIKSVTVATFRIDRTPVTNAQFARFTRQQTQWRRDRVVAVFADQGYLAHWPTADGPSEVSARQPVTQVSWFAASAYCESRGARLPTWHEWELIAAASGTRVDARKDDAWRQQILDWYAQPAHGRLPDVGATRPNIYGVHDVHGVVWEWVEDLGALMVSNDNREQGDPNVLRFCGSGALTLEQKENYAMLMRIAMLSSLQARYTSTTVGFRCAVSGGGVP